MWPNCIPSLSKKFTAMVPTLLSLSLYIPLLFCLLVLFPPFPSQHSNRYKENKQMSIQSSGSPAVQNPAVAGLTLFLEGTELLRYLKSWALYLLLLCQNLSFSARNGNISHALPCFFKQKTLKYEFLPSVATSHPCTPKPVKQ